MKMQYNLQVIGGALILTVIICAGFLIYAQWDLKRFEDSLGEPPKLETPPEAVAAPADVSPREVMTDERPGYTTPRTTVSVERFDRQVLEVDVPERETPAVPLTETELPALDSDSDALSLSNVEFPEEWTDAPAEGIDWVQAKAAGRDYNDFLHTSPEYAYARLADGLREMYGDFPEVDTIVENIKRANEETLTLDDAIHIAEAFSRIMPENQKVSRDVIALQLEFLRELKTLEEYGEQGGIRFDVKVGE